MKRIIRLTESDLTRIVRRVLKEDEGSNPPNMTTKTNAVGSNESAVEKLMSDASNKKIRPDLIKRTFENSTVWGEDIPREAKSWRLNFFINKNQIGLALSTSQKEEYDEVKSMFEGAVSNKIKDNCRIPNKPDGSPSDRTFCVATFREIPIDHSPQNATVAELFEDMIKDIINLCQR